jgi:hypothetical protein
VRLNAGCVAALCFIQAAQWNGATRSTASAEAGP